MQEQVTTTERNWWGTTQRVLLHPALFFKELSADVPYRASLAYLLKTSFVTALVQAIVLAVMMFVILTAFFSIFAFFVGMFGFIFSPFLAALSGLPPEKVIENALAFEKNGNNQLLLFSAQGGLFVFVVSFVGIACGAGVLAAIAHAFIKVLGGTSDFRSTFRTYSFSSAVMLLTLIPIVHIIVGPYGILLNYFGTRQVSGLSKVLSGVVVIAAVAVPLALGTWFASLDPETPHGNSQAAPASSATTTATSSK